ncbi:hypothetical protein BDP55DRAFT_362796 [Colletotrichum godetiae]|uniref:Uncharacterized protein n=1 Tax=Colletotrichum godetiae TaxID=1209918 RepID=A0AAJ0AA24_9PEZI|nr:uncharacterized protein BDP55DRAFT_362796 [Colletotrichum godetiae]KAK1659330.1 hypothetical protein BDP55DRAFT_362796 [Colletotrichum godetiae]
MQLNSLFRFLSPVSKLIALSSHESRVGGSPSILHLRPATLPQPGFWIVQRLTSTVLALVHSCGSRRQQGPNPSTCRSSVYQIGDELFRKAESGTWVLVYGSWLQAAPWSSHRPILKDGTPSSPCHAVRRLSGSLEQMTDRGHRPLGSFGPGRLKLARLKPSMLSAIISRPRRVHYNFCVQPGITSALFILPFAWLPHLPYQVISQYDHVQTQRWRVPCGM